MKTIYSLLIVVFFYLHPSAQPTTESKKGLTVTELTHAKELYSNMTMTSTYR